ncbi:autoinducer binding domain-containing protein [Chromobacterium haemolyticum]|uniref:autoinducer binding domain-containing protein n=1 Tax=Chromobacterium TaxID=535 RepID=UPI0040578202
MQITLSNLPEAVELFRQRTGAVVHDVAVLRRMLIKVRTAHDLEAALAFVQTATGGAPLIMVAFFGNQGFDKALNINLGWPQAWISMYSANQFHRVDPVASGPAGAVFPWSPMLTTLEPRTKLEQHFARAIIEHQMQHGLSFIGEWQDCRVILSMIGKEIEDDRETRDLLEVLMPDLVDVAYRVFASNRKTSQMEVIQQTLIELFCHNGLKKDEIALALGMTRKGVDYHLKQLMDRYAANTIEQLMFKIGACE